MICCEHLTGRDDRRQLVKGDDVCDQTATMDTWRGVYPAICTPFTEDDAVDVEAQRRVVRFALDGGAHGIVAFGLAGEVLKLSRGRAARADGRRSSTRSAAPCRCSSASARRASRASIELARHAEAAGASCVVVPAPMSGAARRGGARRLLRPHRVRRVACR